jgi:hypothetical protein
MRKPASHPRLVPALFLLILLLMPVAASATDDPDHPVDPPREGLIGEGYRIRSDQPMDEKPDDDGSGLTEIITLVVEFVL